MATAARLPRVQELLVLFTLIISISLVQENPVRSLAPKANQGTYSPR
jgi:hypothetical protein